ncbi:MAG: hypothetical protein ACI4AK_08940 [Lepagella sp.]
MEGNEEKEPRKVSPGRLAFGVLMVVVYLGMGALFFMEFFQTSDIWYNRIIGGLLCLYGLFRAYRLIRDGK